MVTNPENLRQRTAVREKLDVSLSTEGLLSARQTALSADGTVLAVGAYQTVEILAKVPSYLFEKSGGTWSQTLKIFDNDRCGTVLVSLMYPSQDGDVISDHPSAIIRGRYNSCSRCE